jgi:hypothetical protein
MNMFNNLGLAPSPRLSAPFPAWAQKDIHLVERAIVLAWQYLRPDAAATLDLNGQTEVEISVKLVDILECMLSDKSIRGFTGRRFSPPARGQELVDVTGDELEKRPDISIRLVSSKPYSNHNSLFFECKRISPKRSVADYINEGLIKFCDQRYAWGMSHAGMLAYVQNLTPTPQANIELEKHWVKKPTSLTIPIYGPVIERSGSIAVTITKHQRHRLLPSGEVSGDITLRHLWLST